MATHLIYRKEKLKRAFGEKLKNGIAVFYLSIKIISELFVSTDDLELKKYKQISQFKVFYVYK